MDEIISEKPFDINFAGIMETEFTPRNCIDIQNTLCTRFINECFEIGIFDIGLEIKSLESIINIHNLEDISSQISSKKFSFCGVLIILLENVRENLLAIKNFTTISKTKNNLFQTISVINSLILSLTYIESVVDFNILKFNEIMRNQIKEVIT